MIGQKRCMLSPNQPTRRPKRRTRVKKRMQKTHKSRRLGPSIFLDTNSHASIHQRNGTTANQFPFTEKPCTVFTLYPCNWHVHNPECQYLSEHLLEASSNEQTYRSVGESERDAHHGQPSIHPIDRLTIFIHSLDIDIGPIGKALISDHPK